ncbi:MAG: DNA polymerase III subunit alpha [Planctomycetota bacterium]|nr:DNA polymerase III subunit alpha [Planctomycetota bacterium]MDA1178307.1 DNA polymerase III subunit alpha [Planctomycetota bacterium]
MERSFVHLHCHSHYSLLDGAASIDKLVKRTVERGMNALALTDHGNLHGSLEFYRKAKSAGINPILGYEAYIAPGSRFAKDAGNMKEASYHLTLLAQNAIGFRNLMKLASAAFLEGFYFKPRIDRELLEHHSEGLVCLSGCVSGELSRTLLSGTGDAGTDLAEARDIVQWFQRVFNERYFLEIQNNGVSIQQDALVRTVELAERVGVPLVATSDAHYADREDAEAQDVMLCINTGKFRTDTQRLRMEGTGFYLRAPDEMYAAFPGHEDAVARSQEIANSVDIQLDLHKRHFPAYSAPSGEEPEAYLRGLCLEGLKTRYLGNPDMLRDGALTEVVMQRLDRELGVINQLGFANYFLIVWDFVRKARELNIPATARGSGVGALVSYALFLSHVCPIRFDLLFERFLDPSRKEAPDIDIDFCKERRGEVIRYVKDKYGEENVAQIGTFGTLAARAAIRDVGRVLGMPLSRVNQIVQMVPEELGISLDEALEKSTDLQAANSGDPEVGELLNLARRIEGLARNVGTHAAAVVIADRPLTEYVPLGRVTGKTDIITQWSMGDVEAAGLLKMDFLGLRNLTILSKAVDLIEQTTGERVDPYAFPLDDAAAFALLCRGETKGIFQLESGGIRDLLQKMKPDSFHDIIATNALYRPGPLEGGMVDDYVAVKHRKKAAVYKHEVLRGILQETNGVMVYQEQVMLILNRLGDIELANAYKCIKAISKKNQATIDSFGEQFLAGAEQKGLKHQDAVELWELIQKFAGYGFNKSHSTAYALIAYMTAYLKAHFPLEFMAALLSGDIPGRNFQRKDALVEHLEDCQRMDVVVVSPDVNQSNADFSVRDGKIQFGLLAIKGVRETAAQAIVDARRQIGKFTDLFHFCEQVDPAECGRSVIESLIKAGAFDSMGARRAQLFDVLERALEVATKQHADRKSGQKNLFAELDEEADPAPVSMPDIPEWNDREKLLMEKEVLGYYLTSHPLAEHESTMSLYCTHTTAKLADVRDRTEIALGGMLSSIKTAHVRKPRSNDEPTKYVNFDLEDTVGTIRCIMWPTEYAEYGSLVQPDAILVAKGVLDRRGGDEANLVVNELLPLSELQAKFTRGIVIRIDEQHHSEENLRQLREILRGYPGNLELHLILSLVNGMRVRLKSTESGVTTDSEMRRRVDELLGPGNFGLLSGKSTKTRSRPPSQRPSGQWAKR